MGSPCGVVVFLKIPDDSLSNEEPIEEFYMSEEKIEVTLSLTREALDLLAVIGTNYVAAGFASDMPVVYSEAIAHELASEIDAATNIPVPKP